MKKQQFAILLASAFLAACGGQRESQPITQQTAAAETSMSADANTPSASASAVAAYVANTEQASQQNPQVIENKLTNPPTEVATHTLPSHRPFVVSANLTFRTDDVRKTSVAIEQLAVQYGGFVVSNQTHSTIIAHDAFKQSDGMLLNIERYVSSADLIVRVPRDKTQVFLHGLQPHITLLEKQNYVAQDIFVNMQREILTAQREQQKAQALQQLNQHATPKTADHSDKERTIENQFAAREREDEAKIQHFELKDKVDYATINLHFSQPENVMKSVRADSESLAKQYREPMWLSVKHALIASGHFLFELFLLFVKTWFVWLGALAAWYLWRKRGSSPKK